MKGLICTAFALALLGGTAAMAQDHGQGNYGQGNYGHGNNGQNYNGQGNNGYDNNGYGNNGQNYNGMDFYRYDEHHQYDRPHWGRGDHYRGHYIEVQDWRGHHLRRPPRGYHWVQTDDGDFILVAVTTGIIFDLMLNSMHH